MEFAILIGIIGLAYYAIGKMFEPPKLTVIDEPESTSQSVPINDPKVECWVCPSCSQYNRVDQPYYHFDKLRCQNCYEVKPDAIEYTSIILSMYWSQARFAQEHFRREAEKAIQKPWIDPSIAKGKSYTIEFEQPKKKLPDDLKDKISQN